LALLGPFGRPCSLGSHYGLDGAVPLSGRVLAELGGVVVANV